MKKNLFIISVLLIFTACTKTEENSQTPNPSLPSLQTTNISDITSTSALSGGTITSSGSSAILEQGVCWNTSSNPTLDNNSTSDDITSNSYISMISSLNPNTTYHVRAYATNSNGTGYGNDLSFTTPAVTSTSIPVLTTSSVTNITQQNATSGGNITSNGGAAITERGICWNIVGNPTILDSKTTVVGSIGSFVANTTQLKAQTTYYVKAYAINSVGVAYGNEITFTTLDFSIQGSNVTDIDGNVYNSVILGGVTWMVQNLKTTKYQNGDLLTYIPVNSDWQSNHPTTGSYCYYNNIPSNDVGYGKLYDYYAATDSRNVAPDGWKVPSKTDWDNLIAYLNFNTTEGAAESLKINTGSYTFQAPNNATNSSGFSAVPGGNRIYNNGSYQNQSTYGCWWTTTPNKLKRLTWNSNLVEESLRGTSAQAKEGLSIRCIKI